VLDNLAIVYGQTNRAALADQATARAKAIRDLAKS
jgi:hypothetical protein